MAIIFLYIYQLIKFLIYDAFSLLFFFRFYKIGKWSYYYCNKQTGYKVVNIMTYNAFGDSKPNYKNKYDALFNINKGYGYYRTTNPN